MQEACLWKEAEVQQVHFSEKLHPLVCLTHPICSNCSICKHINNKLKSDHPLVLKARICICSHLLGISFVQEMTRSPANLILNFIVIQQNKLKFVDQSN